MNAPVALAAERATAVVSVRDLTVRFNRGKAPVCAVNGISFDLMPGEVIR